MEGFLLEGITPMEIWLMDFEIPNTSNWKKRHKLVGIGLISTSLILALFAYVL
jgi:hypothetical protein